MRATVAVELFSGRNKHRKLQTVTQLEDMAVSPYPADNTQQSMDGKQTGIAKRTLKISSEMEN